MHPYVRTRTVLWAGLLALGLSGIVTGAATL